MAKEQEQEKEINENDIFGFDKDKIDEQEEDDREGFGDYDGISSFANDTVEEEENEETPAGTNSDDNREGEEEEEDEENENDDEEDPLFSEDEDKDEEDITEDDVAEFNQKFNKDFQSAQDLKDFLNKDEAKDQKDSNLSELEQAQNVIDHITPLLDPEVTPDEDLLRKQFETIEIQKKRDINNEDVKIEIEDRIEELRDSGKMELEAYKLRVNLKDQVLAPHMEKKESIEKKQQELEKETEKTQKQEIQNSLAKIHSNENFFGIKTDPERINKVYKELQTGKFLKDLQSDKEALSELAVMRAYKEEIFKKASGLTYSDGMKAVLDDFKNTKSKSSGSAITKAQRRGTTGGSDKSNKGLLNSLLK